ncbi:MAG: DinB family protein [Lutibacter sp.]
MKIATLNTNEYAPFYANYLKQLEKFEGTDYFDLLKNAKKDLVTLLKNCSEEQLNFRYAKNKWTIKEIVQHLIDTERILTYRALRFSRNDGVDLPGYNENYFVNQSHANNRSISDLIKEFKVVRKASKELIKSFTEKELLQIGTANECNMSTRAIAYIIIGHQLHHIKVIKERYL